MFYFGNLCEFIITCNNIIKYDVLYFRNLCNNIIKYDTLYFRNLCNNIIKYDVLYFRNLCEIIITCNNNINMMCYILYDKLLKYISNNLSINFILCV